MIKVWGRRSSINVIKVLWALEEAGVQFERETVGGGFGGTDTRDYKKLNPMSLVPVLEDGTIKMFESNAILRYINRRYGKGSLQPRGHKGFALAEQWVEWSNSVILPHLLTVFLNNVRLPADQRDAAAVAAAEKALLESFKIANRMLGRKPWLAGKSFSYADIPLGAMYWRYVNLEVNHAKAPNLERWFDQLKDRPAYQKWAMVPLGTNLEEWTKNEKDLG